MADPPEPHDPIDASPTGSGAADAGPAPASRPELGQWPGPVVGAMLCGGRSRRFGSDKAMAAFGGSTVGERVIAAIRQSGVDPVVAIGGQIGHRLGLPTVPDLRPGDGPLGGLATALIWARTGSVLMVPCDVPLLTSAHIGLLLANPAEPNDPEIGANPNPADRQIPVVATVDGKPQVSLAVRPAAGGRRLLRLLDGGERRLRAALDDRPWHGVEVPPAAVTDADTPEELAELAKGVD